MLKILLVTTNLYPEMGGISETLIKTNSWLNKNNIRTRVLSMNDGDNIKVIFNYKDIISEFDVIHIFSGWNLYVPYLINLSKKLNKKIFFSPLGQLDEWSLQQKSLKKKIALNFYLKKSLERCNAIITASEQEKKDVKKIITNKVLVLGHGVDIPEEKFLLRKKFNENKKKLIFISRLHYKKGIFNLIEAWQKANLKNWELKLYGPISDNLSLLKNKRKIENFEICNPVYGNLKTELVLNSDILILPSLSENFGLIVAESLSLGLPVATTLNTPWAKISKENLNCGWIINQSVEGISSFLKKIENLSIDELKIKSKNAIYYMQKEFDNKNIIKNYINAYEKL